MNRRGDGLERNEKKGVCRGAGGNRDHFMITLGHTCINTHTHT